MRLSSIKLAGFKSFVEPTKIPFPDQMTCVVGPNGCGKSNVIDAVRWVLGESSAKNLRGDAMTDVIFNGAASRKPVSQASVELLFDNTQGRLPNTLASRNQVAIKRLVTREGQSEYFINGAKCRKRDITDIFLGTGLGARSYAIIEQGMISRLIESKPHELRHFLEEAAGVSKYKERRRETQNRIRSTRENLERLLDLRQELQLQLDTLATQAEQASQYRELKASQRELKGQLAVLKWQRFHQQQVAKSAELEKLQNEVNFLQQAQQGDSDVLGALTQQLQQCEQQVQQAQQQGFLLDNQLTKAEQNQLHTRQQQQQLQQQQRQLQDSQYSATHAYEQQQEHLELCQEHALEAEQTLEDQSHALSELKQQLHSEKQRFEQLQSSQNQFTAQQHQLEKAQQQSVHNVEKNQQLIEQTTRTLQTQNEQLEQLNVQDASSKLAQLNAQLQQLQHEISQADTIQQNLQHTADEHQQALNYAQQQCEQTRQQLQQQQAQLKLLDTLLEDYQQSHQTEALLLQLEVQKGYAHCVELALTQFQQLSVVDLTDSTEPEAPLGINSLHAFAREIRPESLAQFVLAGQYPDYLDRVAYHQSGDTQILQDDYWLGVMDAQGVLHGRHWQLKPSQQEAGAILQKREQHQELTAQVQQSLTTLQTQQKIHAQCEQEYTAINQQVAENKTLIQNLKQQQASAQGQFDSTQIQQQQHQKQVQQTQQQLNDTQAQLQQYQQQQSQLQHALKQSEQALTQHHSQSLQQQTAFAAQQQAYQQLQQQLAQQTQSQQQAQLGLQQAQNDTRLAQAQLQNLAQNQQNQQQQLQAANEQLEELIEPLECLAVEIDELLTQKSQQQQQLHTANEQHFKAQSELEEKQAMLANAHDKTAQLQQQLVACQLAEQSVTLKAQQALEPLSELNQTLKQVLEQLPEQAEQKTWQQRLSKIDKQLAALGAVNLAAIEQYQQAQSRKQYLDEQNDDLSQALATLEAAIAKIDKQTKSQFKATFEQVNNSLKLLFPKVFCGGSAYLELTDNDLLESGVTIMARPPGKKNSTIHLLSGGEKALTALSLVFSIFRLNPAPFCMLDEVDAPLDDANVGRFCKLVEEMSQDVQFIYISHNKIAMEMAGRLTGVTMAEAGVSRMVAVDIDQAIEMAQT